MILLEEFGRTHHTLLEMAKVGKVLDFIICVYSDEGPIPHFHVVKGDVKCPDKVGCIRMDKAEYFDHGFKNMYLNTKERHALCGFFDEIWTRGITQWEHIVLLWNDNNSDYAVDEDTEMPDYMNLEY